jgi:Domain of unknown function (DUF4216)
MCIIGVEVNIDSNTGFTLVNVDCELCTNATDPYILASQAKLTYYVRDIKDPKYLIVIKTQPRDTYDMPNLENIFDSDDESTTVYVQENEDIGGTYIVEGDDDIELRRTDVDVVTEDLLPLSLILSMRMNNMTLIIKLVVLIILFI